MQKVKNSPLLPVVHTQVFAIEIKNACRGLDVHRIRQILVDYGLIDLPDTPDFLYQAIGIFKDFEEKSNVREVKTHDSKCIACSFGKTVKVFEVTYVKPDDQGSPFRLQYTKSFAINLDIVEGRLMDFGWCNAFLSRQEMEKLD